MPKNLDIFKIVDVLIAFDVDEILKSNNNSLSQHPDQPTSLGNNPDTVYMITTLANAAYGFGHGTTSGQNEGEGGSNLRIKAQVDDVIGWRTVSLTGTADYKCFLYDFVPKTANLLGYVSYLTDNSTEPYPARGWPENDQVKEEPRADYYAKATVISQYN